MADESRPYGKDAQIFTFGVHGTNNGPDNVREVTRRISSAVGETTHGANLFDSGFSWQNHSGTLNQTRDRDVASKDLASYVLRQIDRAEQAGTLDKSKPLTVNLVGFSHGGNVAILASDEIADGLKQRGIQSAIHLTTLSTPAYTHGPENPDRAAALVQRDGVQFAQTHFSVAGDGVIRGALGNANYDTDVTRNYNMKGVSTFNGIANHGAPQNSEGHMDAISGIMRQRFNGLAPAQQHSQANDGVEVANASPGLIVGGAGAPVAADSWQRFNADPLVQQASAALHRAMPEVAQEHQNPSLVAGLAGAAASNGFERVQDVAFSRDQQTAFVTDRDKHDPAARVAPLGLEVASTPFDQVWSKAAPALDAAQVNEVAAQEQSRKHSAPSMA